ncbi:transcriptional regulator, TraR/DksA family [Desulfonispora thiosulfatigenes DSM 11270]|uniref:Transcriptional regulator, TraR/DksA family n=1 Tax=Desulfonispora thiosulfatigenes DSM 11270 TaxID=656914 RepID=A0A1W1VJZ8_DESTI|nr:TraR/DksA C4-type zinc finger protein [Desulfonispora thiosulfatigenes]SMB93264.1 transcriptional regulator, TraR/DksA family [Desulfonispora thiosulfatigenes DSM 11270]
MDNARKKLEEVKNDYENVLNSVNEGLNSAMNEGLSELSVYDNHPGDIGTEMYEREKDIGTRVYLENQIKKVEDAFHNLDKGKYGICEQCQKQIPKERLEILPFTTMCVNCSQQFSEDEYNHYKRPVEQQIVKPPFNEQSIDSNLSGFDGEDAWAQVAYYGTSETPYETGAIDYKDMYNDQE